METAGNLVMLPAGLEEVAQKAAEWGWLEEDFGGSDLRSFLARFFPLPLPGSEEAFQTIFSPEGPVGVTKPGFFRIS